MIDITEYGLDDYSIKYQEDKILFLNTGVYCMCEAGRELTLVRGKNWNYDGSKTIHYDPPIGCPTCKVELTKKLVTAAFLYGYKILSHDYMCDSPLRIYHRDWRL